MQKFSVFNLTLKNENLIVEITKKKSIAYEGKLLMLLNKRDNNLDWIMY